jgi:trans-aconitate methyltransferase
MVPSKSYHENVSAAYPTTKISDMDGSEARIEAARDRGRDRQRQIEHITGVKKEQDRRGI